jgi:hypothetical protein
MQNTCSSPPQDFEPRGKNRRQSIKKQYDDLRRPQHLNTQQQPSPRAPDKMAAPSNRKLVSRNQNYKLDRHKRITIKKKIVNKI